MEYNDSIYKSNYQHIKIHFEVIIMKKTIIILFFAIIFVQNMFAWGGALRDVTNQPSATPTFYLGDVATFAWATSKSVPLVKIGVGILASPPAAYTNLTWNIPTEY